MILPFNFATDVVSSDMTLFAKWTPKTYTINYNEGIGATVNPSSVTKTYGTAYKTDLLTQSETGYTFNGGYTTSSLTTAYEKTKQRMTCI